MNDGFSVEDLEPNNSEKYKVQEMSASEALYSFFSWLSTCDTVVKIGSSCNAAPIADLIGEFCKLNSLSEPKEGWQKQGIKVPKSTMILMVDLFKDKRKREAFYKFAKDCGEKLNTAMNFSSIIVINPFNNEDDFNLCLDFLVLCDFAEEYKLGESQDQKARYFISSGNTEFFLQIFLD